MKKKAIIFDMDGVISDTQIYHSRIWSEVLAKYGINISPEEITLRYAGAKSREVFLKILANHNLEQKLEEVLREKARLQALWIDKGVMPIEGAPELIKKLFDDGRDLAVASGGGRRTVEFILDTLGLRKYFSVVTTADDVSSCKPSPELFLLAAYLLGRAPNKCIVIEDSRNGMLAARLAGMYCIGLVFDENDKKTYPADRLVNTLTKLGVSDFD